MDRKNSSNPEAGLDGDAAWQWQLQHRITTPAGLEDYIELNDEERAALIGPRSLPFSVTPYYASLLQHPALRRTVVPSMNEECMNEEELEDPLGEEAHRVTRHLIHTYPDKVLLLVTAHCPVYCRYCTRSRLAGRGQPDDTTSFDASFDYIVRHSAIRDVLVSGGEALSLPDDVLNRLLGRLRSIPHIRTIRIGSKVPAVMPMRITDGLCAVLRRHRVWLSLHFTHPAELTPACRTACLKLSDHGIAMASQTVLLKGINDDRDILTDLFYGLLEINVKPYYLLQCDPVAGSARFRTPVERGVELIRSLHGSLSGLAVPQYVIDAPGGGGKVPILSLEQLRFSGARVEFTNHAGDLFSYPAG